MRWWANSLDLWISILSATLAHAQHIHSKALHWRDPDFDRAKIKGCILPASPLNSSACISHRRSHRTGFRAYIRGKRSLVFSSIQMSQQSWSHRRRKPRSCSCTNFTVLISRHLVSFSATYLACCQDGCNFFILFTKEESAGRVRACIIYCRMK